MSINTYLMQSLPKAELEQVANFVSEFTSSPAGLEAKLLPLSVAEVAANIGVIVCEGAEFRGYAGISPPVTDSDKIELGPFIVPTMYRRQGIGRTLVAATASLALQEGYMPYVFGNEANMGNLTRAGFTACGKEDLPSSSYELCVTKCPFFKPSESCCNTPVMLQDEAWSQVPPMETWPEGRVLQM